MQLSGVTVQLWVGVPCKESQDKSGRSICIHSFDFSFNLFVKFGCKHTRNFTLDFFFGQIHIQLRTRTTKGNKVTLYNVVYFICIDI